MMRGRDPHSRGVYIHLRVFTTVPVEICKAPIQSCSRALRGIAPTLRDMRYLYIMQPIYS
jgi:hypothetical protein